MIPCQALETKMALLIKVSIDYTIFIPETITFRVCKLQDFRFIKSISFYLCINFYRCFFFWSFNVCVFTFVCFFFYNFCSISLILLPTVDFVCVLSLGATIRNHSLHETHGDKHRHKHTHKKNTRARYLGL